MSAPFDILKLVEDGKVAVDDIVHIKASVAQVDVYDRHAPLKVWVDGAEEPTWVGAEDVVAHVPTPKPFKAGDKVKHRDWVHAGTILSIYEPCGLAWVSFNNQAPSTYVIAALEHAS